MAVLAQLIGGPLDGQELDLSLMPDRNAISAVRFQVEYEGEPTGQVAVYAVKVWRKADQWALVFRGYEEEER